MLIHRWYVMARPHQQISTAAVTWLLVSLSAVVPSQATESRPVGAGVSSGLQMLEEIQG